MTRNIDGVAFGAKEATLKYRVIAWILAALGSIGFVSALIFQVILKIQKYGTASYQPFVPHWSVSLACSIILFFQPLLSTH